jgi:hypothetical protein
MEIPSWAFASAGKSLSQPERTIVPIPVPVPVPVPVSVYVTKIKTPEPAIYTFYDDILDTINDMIPKQSLLMSLLLELYI